MEADFTNKASSKENYDNTVCVNVTECLKQNS